MALLELESLVYQFENCTLPREAWTHRAHLSVALWYLFHFPRNEATARIRGGIQRYNHSLGITAGYHETVTLFWIDVLCSLLQKSPAKSNLEDLVEESIIKFGVSDYLLRHFSRERLFSDQARKEWVEPDLIPLESAVA
jgi:hypothetical protein